jgi:hypothetical protein
MDAVKAVSTTGHALDLRVGDWVEVKSAAEILATLDETQCVDGLPFMPEMLQYCGRRFRVYRSAHKTANTIEIFAIRRMANAVHLEELRCNGSSHGGCQAGCLLFWKECWLKRVAGGGGTPHPSPENGADDASLHPLVAETLSRGTTRPAESGQPTRYRCQATEMLRATSDVRRRDRWNPLFYVRDLTSGNVNLFDFVRFGSLAMVNAFLLRWFGWRYPRLRGLAGKETPSGELNLRPGELVRVLPKADIMRTLNGQLRNRGLWFDVEMVPYCDNQNYRVLRRVERIINEKTGDMINLPNPCVILDGVTCSGNYSYQRMFSRRHEYAYFREIWLKRVDEGVSRT